MDALLNLQAAQPQRYPVLLDSAASSDPAGREQSQNHDVLMAFPGERLLLSSDGCSAPPSRVNAAGNFLAQLDQWWHALRTAPASAADDSLRSLPFTGGWFVYLSYEFAAQIEPRLSLPTAAHQLIAQAVRVPCAIVRDTVTQECFFIAEQGFESGLQQVQSDLLHHAATANAAPLHDATLHDITLMDALHEDPPERFLQAVTAALDHIAAGDVYQANLSRGWRSCLPQGLHVAQLYRRLRHANPAPYAGLVWLDEQHVLLSSSPERLIEVREGWANTRPIAGTRPRASDLLSDQALVTELRMHPKERAEHIMLLDLERNDLGRICMSGSVEVNEYMSIESYAHVHHIVSNVRGRLRADTAPGTAIAAVFPGGTITGCPKFRCMQLIAELEGTPRSAYTGSMGYLNRDGSMDLNILIRTLELQGKELSFRAGAGIVADSIPTRELDETRAKALGLLRALSATE